MSSYRGGCEVLEGAKNAACSLGRFQCEIETEPVGEVWSDSDATLLNVDETMMRRMCSRDAKLILRLDNDLEAGFYVPAPVAQGEPLPIVLKSALRRAEDTE